MSKIKVLVFSSYFLPGYKGGGPIKTIDNLFRSLCHVYDFSLITNDRDLGDDSTYLDVQPNQWSNISGVPVFYVSPGSIGLFKVFKIIFYGEYDIIYLNSFFSLRFSFFPLLISLLLRKKILLAPRGEFSDGALSIKSTKKNIFINFSKIFGLHSKLFFQASSNFERNDIYKVIGQKAKVLVAEDIGSNIFVDSFFPIKSSPLLVVTVARIAPVKNITFALDVLCNVNQPVVYHIYGPIEDNNYWQQCLHKINSLPPHISVTYKGSLSPERVLNKLSEYNVFLLPTKGENYCHVIAEALCAALPVIVADTTPWRDLDASGIGWDLSLSDPESFSSKIEELALTPPDVYGLKRLHILKWAKIKFSEQGVIDENIKIFSKVFHN